MHAKMMALLGYDAAVPTLNSNNKVIQLEAKILQSDTSRINFSNISQACVGLTSEPFWLTLKVWEVGYYYVFHLPDIHRRRFINHKKEVVLSWIVSSSSVSPAARMLQHQTIQSPARLGLTGPGCPAVQNPTPSRHGHPTSSSSSQSHHHQQIQQPPNLPPSSTSTTSSSTTIASSPLLSLLPPLPRAQSLLQQMSVLTSKLFDDILSQFNSLQTQLFEAVTELQEILDLQDAKQKLSREVKSKDSSLLEFSNKLKEAERVLNILVDDYSDYRKPKRTKTDEDDDENESSSSSSSVTTTVSSQLKLKDILAYAHKISYTTFAPPEFGAGQTPLCGALPPAPQDEQMRASQLYTFADLNIGLPKTVETIEKKIESLIELPPPPPPESMNLSAIQNLLPPNIAIPSGWKPGMPVELPKDWPMPPPAPRAQEQQQMRPPIGLHRPPDVIQV
ncbi:unnamed protein product [Eruca vesicaria subsp. sativa]|uniref:Mediator of RNA polymerase II transcription subunit 4 n=1 Tax=Eruca vesicaria subsp. sativa TaxID=29727 RepID=A0ABC8JIL0_ERUVS|nr:unnamed protein product [Eruca vesicaria subsp. sativa]